MDTVDELTVRDAGHPSHSLVHAVNLAEFAVVAWLMTIVADLRISTALAVRGRTRAEAYRYAHAAELAERMPDLFELLYADGRCTLDHLDVVWSRINRHLTTLDRVTRELLRPAVDAAVAGALVEWMEAGCPPSLEAFSLVTDETLNAVAGDIVTATEQRERDTQCLTKRATKLILDCGDEITAASTWAAIGDRARTLHREARRVAEASGSVSDVPTMSQCRARVLLDQLGDTPETMTVTVNLYRTTVDGRVGCGGAFIPGVGYVSEVTADLLESVADLVRELPRWRELEQRETASYPFTRVQKAGMEGRDGHCRFPGCDIAADRCEHDHIVNSVHTSPDSDGPTSVANGMCLCPLHHALKTAGLWRAWTDDNGFTVVWEGPGGVVAVTRADGPLSPLRIGPDG
ncbi:HNH endonuclease signature motif containing protein [Corynebacterium terpenotabidum]|uniref:HNH nuclease domain-containing protein n=1 Tax=Corynebacterium terpenotabidum Y-11 TaxID=1200352 RepID=S4XII7_9CORY|nr:HNH endonuclease signature motif containing protein [Corynebacterium terpenotabidum]AGP30423.1 hypothetical protein A606_03870 [Corynebacterium terpenotabidum Y-11]